jgi:membrane dipeptidase
MLIVDAHLDLAYNVRRGRDVRRAAVEQPIADNEIATVGLPDLRAGNVGLVCATIFCSPAGYGKDGYTNPDEARQQALWQLDVYRRWIVQRLLQFITDPSQLPTGIDAGPQAAILLLEGADAIRTPDDLDEWFNAGLRIVGLAWKRTRYAGGTTAPGPLTPEGVELINAMDRYGIIHDASHLAEESFWQLLDVTPGPVIASHSNCRAFVPTDRQLSDEMIKALVVRDGVIGINFYDKFLLPKDQQGSRRATLDDVVHHMKHIIDLAGSAQHVAIGTDLDGGLGREQIPQEITTIADLPKLADALSSAGFSDADVLGVMGGNWLRFFQRSLPGNVRSS